MVLKHDEVGHDSNDAFVDYDEEMLEADSESDDDKPDTETSGQTVAMEDGDIGNILIGGKGSRVRYKVNTELH